MLWIKALHVISVIAWMAALLYLPRLFVYHAGSVVGSQQSETFKIMERRLIRAIMTPAMIGTWGFGLWLVFGFNAVSFDISAGWGWVWVKGALVVLMTGFHVYLSKLRKVFAADNNTRSAKYFRIINEVPTLLMIGTVILVIVKPF